MSDEQQAALAEPVESAPTEGAENASQTVDIVDQQSTEPADESVNAEASTTSEESDSDNTGEKSGDDTPAEQPKVKKGVQKRIDELTAKRLDAERERDYYKQLAEKQNVSNEITAEPVKPDISSFDDYDQYAEAMEDYANQKAAWIDHQNKQQLSEQQKQLETQKRTWQYQDRAAQFAQANPDYFAVTGNPSLQITQEMTDVILDSDAGPQLSYYLGKNPELAAQIAQLPSHMQYMEMGRLNHDISSRKLPEKTVTKAPTPIKPVGTNSNVEKDPSDMSYDEFVAWRQKTKAARR